MDFHKNEKIIVSDVLKKDEELGNNSAVEDCCFKEVKTKNGTRMVLSVSNCIDIKIYVDITSIYCVSSIYIYVWALSEKISFT